MRGRLSHGCRREGDTLTFEIALFGRGGMDINIQLEPANKKYETIRPTSRLVVEGVVSSVIRKLV